jgi:hypothetical protein
MPFGRRRRSRGVDVSSLAKLQHDALECFIRRDRRQGVRRCYSQSSPFHWTRSRSPCVSPRLTVPPRASDYRKRSSPPHACSWRWLLPASVARPAGVSRSNPISKFVATEDLAAIDLKPRLVAAGVVEARAVASTTSPS